MFQLATLNFIRGHGVLNWKPEALARNRLAFVLAYAAGYQFRPPVQYHDIAKIA